MHATKHIDHARYPKYCRGRTEAELRHIIADCRATLDAWPDQPNAGYYLDEINYAADELYRRQRGHVQDPRYVEFYASPLYFE